MSAWFVMSALGFYPTDPCDLKYSIGRPLVKTAKVQVERGFLDIKTFNNSIENLHVQSACLNGVPLQRLELPHADLISGGELFFLMGDKPVDLRKHPLRPCSHLILEPCICGNRVCVPKPKPTQPATKAPSDMPASAPDLSHTPELDRAGVAGEEYVRMQLNKDALVRGSGSGAIMGAGAGVSLLVFSMLALRKRCRRATCKREN